MDGVPPPADAANDSPREDGAPNAFSGPTSPTPALHHSQSHLGAYQSAGYSSIPLQHYGNPQQHAFTSQLDMSQSPESGRGGPYNMNAMANALPQHNYRPGQYAPMAANQQQRFSTQAASPSSMANQMAAQQQYEGQGGINPLANQQFYLPQHAAGMAQYYSTPMSPPQLQTNVSTRTNMGYYPSPVLMNQQAPSSAAYYYPQAGHYNAQAQAMPTQLLSAQYMPPTPPQSDPRMAGAQPTDHFGSSIYSQHDRGSLSLDNKQNIVRGPPRKPRQSGHAIWIGNLPPNTDLISLVHHVCKEANGLESLFLISKSNCAFANFKDERTCVVAQQKLHDSKFRSVRLVSRLRRNTVEGAAGVTAPTGPAAGVSHLTPPSDDGLGQPEGVSDVQQEGFSPVATSDNKAAASGSTPVDGGRALSSSPQKDKFFILKSLTVEDLELSVQTGIWATQSHNEEVLNKAYEAAENVYLVFSANKSGEYFGYARMTSPINDDPAAAIEFAPKAQTATDLDLPKAIATEATEFAPKGRIIDDSARGTIFWEAERDDNITDGGQQQDGAAEEGSSGSGPGSVEDASSVRSGYGGKEIGENKAWGKPFKLEWLSTTKLPFYRTRGLRNPWNSNREVKIARDGTELEPSVGRRLIGLFNRVQSPAPPGAVVGVVPGGMRGAVQMVSGYTPMRPPYQP